MTAPTIPPQQPEPERECGNCEFFIRARDYLIGRVTCPCCEQTRQCVPDCTFAEDCWDGHCEMELARTALHGPKES